MKSNEYENRAIYEDREGNLWIGSVGGGLIRLKKRAVTTYTTDNGLPSNTVFAVTDDGIGGTWIATGSGLARLQCGENLRLYGQGRHAVAVRDSTPS